MSLTCNQASKRRPDRACSGELRSQCVSSACFYMRCLERGDEQRHLRAYLTSLCLARAPPPPHRRTTLWHGHDRHSPLPCVGGSNRLARRLDDLMPRWVRAPSPASCSLQFGKAPKGRQMGNWIEQSLKTENTLHALPQEPAGNRHKPVSASTVGLLVPPALMRMRLGVVLTVGLQSRVQNTCVCAYTHTARTRTHLNTRAHAHAHTH
jgi:hypothetical protein